MKIVRYFFLVGIILVGAGFAHAADKNGQFFMGGGVGGVKCGAFVSSMEKGRSFGVGTAGQIQETQGFTMYVLGFQTGYNMGAVDTYDIFDASKSINELLSKIEKYCRKNTVVRFGDAVVALAEEMFPKRKKKLVLSQKER